MRKIKWKKQNKTILDNIFTDTDLNVIGEYQMTDTVYRSGSSLNFTCATLTISCFLLVAMCFFLIAS